MQLLLEHGADPTQAVGGTPLVTEAAQQARRDPSPSPSPNRNPNLNRYPYPQR